MMMGIVRAAAKASPVSTIVTAVAHSIWSITCAPPKIKVQMLSDMLVYPEVSWLQSKQVDRFCLFSSRSISKIAATVSLIDSCLGAVTLLRRRERPAEPRVVSMNTPALISRLFQRGRVALRLVRKARQPLTKLHFLLRCPWSSAAGVADSTVTTAPISPNKVAAMRNVAIPKFRLLGKMVVSASALIMRAGCPPARSDWLPSPRWTAFPRVWPVCLYMLLKIGHPYAGASLKMFAPRCSHLSLCHTL